MVRSNKKSYTKQPQIKILLDEDVFKVDKFPLSKHRFTIKHVRDDFHMGGKFDAEVFRLAEEQGFMIVTFNGKDFLRLAKSKISLLQNNFPSIVNLSKTLRVEQIDNKLVSSLSGLSASKRVEHYLSISTRNFKLYKIS